MSADQAQAENIDSIQTSRYVADRDPNHMHDDLEISFQDIFAEPAGTQTTDETWNLSEKTFNKTSASCYKCLTTVCAVPMAFIWAILFSCLFCEYIWCVTPWLKYVRITVRPIREIFQMMLSVFVVPCFDAAGYVFGRIKVTNVAESAPRQAV